MKTVSFIWATYKQEKMISNASSNWLFTKHFWLKEFREEGAGEQEKEQEKDKEKREGGGRDSEKSFPGNLEKYMKIMFY